jgi:hypothetical protein
MGMAEARRSTLKLLALSLRLRLWLCRRWTGVVYERRMEMNEITQRDKKDVLRNDEAQTYLSRAEAEVGNELGGRFRHLGKVQVVGAGPVKYPTMPEGNPWKENPVPNVPDPLGFSVEDEK